MLVEGGFLRGEELPRAIRDHVLRIIDSTFPWIEGTWLLEEGQQCHENILLDLPSPLLLAEGIRHRMESEQLWPLLGGPGQSPSLRPDVALGREAELAEELLMSPAQEELMVHLDGTRDLGALSRDPDIDELELLSLVYTLHVLDLVELSEDVKPGPKQTAQGAALDKERLLDRLQLCREADYFAVLGLQHQARRADVRRAYKELSQTFADDVIDPSILSEFGAELEEVRTALEEAQEILADDELRGAYLVHLETA